MNPLPNRRQMAGFSLVEMMISMLLGLMILAAAIAVFSSNRASYQANQGLGRIQENARVAFEMLARDLRAAGSTGCSVAAKPETIATAPYWMTFPTQPVASPGPPTATASETLQILSAGDAQIGVESQTAGSLTLRSAAHPFQDNDMLVVCDAAKVFVFQATTVSGATINHGGLPGGYDFFDNIMPSSASVVAAALTANNWYVDDNGRGGSAPRSLFVQRFGGAREEIAEGIDDLSLQFLERGEDAYDTAATVTDWNNVIAVRVELDLSATDPTGNPINRTMANVISLRTRNL